MYRQILNATKANQHFTFPYPFYYGQNTAQRCWIQVGQNRDNVNRRTSYNHRLIVQHFNPDTFNSWTNPRTSLSASIILLYTSTHADDLNQNLPQTISINLITATPQDIYNFISPPAHPTIPNESLPYHQRTPLPTRYFNNLQRQILLKALKAKDQEIDPDHVLWSEPTDPAQIAELAKANEFLFPVTRANLAGIQSKRQQKEAAANSPEALQTKFFKIYTKSEHVKERPDDLGWPNPQALKTHDLKYLDEAGRNRPNNLERWAKMDAIYTHWNNLPALLQAIPNLHPNEILRLAAIYKEVTGETMPIPQPIPQPA